MSCATLLAAQPAQHLFHKAILMPGAGCNAQSADSAAAMTAALCRRLARRFPPRGRGRGRGRG